MAGAQRTLADGFFARAVARRGETLYVGTQDEGIIDVPLQSRPAPRAPSDGDRAGVFRVRLAKLEGEPYAIGENCDLPLRSVAKAVAAGPHRRALPLLADRNVASLALSGGRLWVGYFDRGLDIVDANSGARRPSRRRRALLHQSNRGRWRRRAHRGSHRERPGALRFRRHAAAESWDAKTACFPITSPTSPSAMAGWWRPRRRASPSWTAPAFAASTSSTAS